MTQEFTKLVDKLYANMEYRPVGVAVLYRGETNDKRFLVIQAAKVPEAWAFPQGVVDRGEKLEDTLSRELAEELGIDLRTDVTDVKSAYHYETLDAEATRKDKRGFSKGKAYFFTLGQYVGNGEFNLCREEVAEAKWMDYGEALRYFNLGRPERAALLKRALDRAIEMIGK